MDGNFQTVERVALGKDPAEASRVFAEYFKQRKPVIITDAIPRKVKKNWSLANQRKKFGKKTVMVRAQRPLRLTSVDLWPALPLQELPGADE